MKLLIRPLRWLYGLYTLTVLLLLVAISVLLLIVLPTLDYRRRLVRSSSRLFFFLAGMPLQELGLDMLPETACVVAANHASYLDGIILTAVLPPHFGFVIKQEVTNVPVVHYLLRRIGSQFVERFNPGRSARDALRLLRAAGNGDELVFFPEGTFELEPGLRRFQIGAFAAATHAKLPIAPVIIHGSRQILPSDEWATSPGKIKVEVLQPVPYQAGRTAHELRDIVHDIMRERVDQPDG